MIQTFLVLLALQYHSGETTNNKTPTLDNDVCAIAYLLKDDNRLWTTLHAMSNASDKDEEIAEMAYTYLENFEGCNLNPKTGYNRN